MILILQQIFSDFEKIQVFCFEKTYFFERNPSFERFGKSLFQSLFLARVVQFGENVNAIGKHRGKIRSYGYCEKQQLCTFLYNLYSSLEEFGIVFRSSKFCFCLFLKSFFGNVTGYIEVNQCVFQIRQIKKSVDKLEMALPYR